MSAPEPDYITHARDRRAFAYRYRPAERKKTDKYSWRLYQRILKKGRERVYISTWCNTWGVEFTPDLEQLKQGCGKQISQIMIGREIEPVGWFGGRIAYQIMRTGTRVDESFAYSGEGFMTKNWLDITDWYWSEYERIGVCLYGQLGRGHHFIRINRNSRKCEHCGKHERRQILTKKTIERREVWS